MSLRAGLRKLRGLVPADGRWLAGRWLAGRWLARGLAVLIVVLAGLWLLDITTAAATAGVSRVLVVGAAVLTVVLVARTVLRLRRRRPELLVLLALGVLLGYGGLAHEVGAGTYADEGHYLHHANQVNDGRLFTASFIYPHLLYYLDAFALWLAGLFAGLTARASEVVFGVADPGAVPWLVLRWVQAALGVSAVVPVYHLAAGLAGRRAGTLAAALQVFSVHYHLGFQVNISDIPSASLAAWCLMYVGRLTRRESLGDYLRAGIFSGLAAAAKYPAGTVAVAIAAVWTFHRLRGWLRAAGPRTWRSRLGLLWAGLASLATFVVFNPSWIVFTDAAIHGKRGVFFGVRQYGQGGWIGVTPPSNVVYYFEKLRDNFGLAVAVVAVIGLVQLPDRIRRRLLWLLPFPLAFFALISSMNMVVLRNLFPLLPAVAAGLGVAVSGCVWWLRRVAAARSPGVRLLGRPAAAAVVGMLCLAQPATATVLQTLALARASTREQMAEWVRRHVPRGAGILKESYTSRFFPDEYRTIERRFAFRIAEERFDDPRYDYLLLAGHAYNRFFLPENQSDFQAAWYRRIFETFPLVHTAAPGKLRLGPELRLYRLPGRNDRPRRRRVFRPPSAFLTHPSMEREDHVRFTEDGRTAIFRGTFVAGLYELRLQGDLGAGGALVVRDLDNRVVAEAAAAPVVGLELPRGPVLVAVSLPAGSRLASLAVLRRLS